MVALLSPPISQTSFAGLAEARRATDIAEVAATLSGAVLRGDRFVALTADHADMRGHILGLLAEILAEHAVHVELREPEEIYHLVDGLDRADPGGGLASWASSASNGDPYTRRPLFVIESAETLPPDTIEFLWLASTVLLTGPLAPQILFSGATQFQTMLRSHECRGIREHIATNVAMDAASPPHSDGRACLTAPAIAEAPSTPPPERTVRRVRLKWAGLAAAVFVCAGMGAALVFDDAAPTGPGPASALPTPGPERPRMDAEPAMAAAPQSAGPAKDVASQAAVAPPTLAAASPLPAGPVGSPPEQSAQPPAPAAASAAQAPNERLPFAPPPKPTEPPAAAAAPQPETGQVRPSATSPSTARLAQIHVVLQYRAGSADSETQARQIAASLAGRVASAQVKAVPALSRTPKIRYFDREDRDAAVELNALLSGALGKARPRHQTDKSGQAPSAVIEVQLPRPQPAHGTPPMRVAHQQQ